MSDSKHTVGQYYDVILVTGKSNIEPVKASYLGNNIWSVANHPKKEMLITAKKNGTKVDATDDYEYESGSTLSFTAEVGVSLEAGVSFIAEAKVTAEAKFTVEHTSFEQVSDTFSMTLQPGECGTLVQSKVVLDLYRDLGGISIKGLPTLSPLEGDKKNVTISFGLIESVAADSEQELEDYIAGLAL